MEHARYAKLLARDFKAEKPLRRIVTHVACIKHRGKWFALSAYRSLLNNERVE